MITLKFYLSYRTPHAKDEELKKTKTSKGNLKK